MSLSLTATSPGSPSNCSSVVPSSSMSSQGRAKVIRYLSIGVASAAFHGAVRLSTRCAPLERRIEGAAAGSSMRRRWSTQGPVALSTRRAFTPNSSPDSRSFSSAPVTRPPVKRSPVTSAWLRTTAPDSTAARTVIRAMRASFIWSSPYTATALRLSVRSSGTSCAALAGESRWPTPSPKADSAEYAKTPAPSFAAPCGPPLYTGR